MIVDFTAHIIPKSVLGLLDNLPLSKDFPPGKWFTTDQADPERRIKMMKKYGIDMQVLSLGSPHLAGTTPEQAASLCKNFNDDIAKMCEKYPDKFLGLAAVSLRDIESALDELDRAVKQLGLKGVMTATQLEGDPIDSPRNGPFFEKMVNYDVPLFLHPMPWKSYKLAEDYRIMHIFGWPFDTTVSVARLIFSGTLDKYPSLKVVTHHLGAGLSFFTGRMNTTYNMYFSDKLKRSLPEYYKMIYGDTALDGGTEGLISGYEFFGPDRMVFGTDYPYGPDNGEVFLNGCLRGVQGMKVSAEDLEKIFFKNAFKLLKIN